MLELANVNSGYGDVQVLWNINLRVEKGEIVSIIGPNGAGKTTLLKTIAGLIRPFKKGSGKIVYLGERIDGKRVDEIVNLGIVLVSGEKGIFPYMSVMDNLLMGAYNKNARSKRMENLEKVFQLFPRLKERKNQKAGTLSGGERQMLAIGQGIMANPRLMMLDEPSLGIQPSLAIKIFDALTEIRRLGMTILLVEQNVYAALRISDRGYVLENGRIVLKGPSSELLDNKHVKKAYMAL
jgi:branched-chain amino acid transport system ATP-binding protein